MGRVNGEQGTMNWGTANVLVCVGSFRVTTRNTDLRACAKNSRNQRLTLPRWSSSGHDKGMHNNEFAGSLDFNQHTREINVFDILLEVQSAQT